MPLGKKTYLAGDQTDVKLILVSIFLVDYSKRSWTSLYTSVTLTREWEVLRKKLQGELEIDGITFEKSSFFNKIAIVC